MSVEEQGGSPLPKRDPKGLKLRGSPRPVIRFRRGLIVAIAAVLSATLGGLAWVALEPPSFRLATDKDVPELTGKVAPEALAAAPATYADVPRLGPPLPGDLGRPILDRQSRPGDGGIDAERAEKERAVEAERERHASELRSARGSSILVHLEQSGRSVTPEGDNDAASLPPERLPAAFGARGPAEPSQRLTLSAGTIIPASLITGLNSDLPGIVLAQVTQPVCDSATGRTVLIPQGARLIGSYDDKLAFGQQRALLMWQRIVFPDGSSIALDKLTSAADRAGEAGVRDRVDSHGWRLLKGVILSTLLGAGSELSLANEGSELVRAVRESTQQAGESAGAAIVSKDLDAEPTLRVRPGWPVLAVLHEDLALKPWSA